MSDDVDIVRIEPPIDEGWAAETLVRCDGNVTRAAGFMGVDSGRLRAFIDKRARLSAIIAEAIEGAVDESIGVLFEGLRDRGSFQNRFYAAKEFLRSGAGRRRGFGQPTHGNVLVAEAKETGSARIIELKWLEPVREVQAVKEEGNGSDSSSGEAADYGGGSGI